MDNMFVQVLLLLIGFVLLIKGADFFVEGCSSVARQLKVPSLIIGLTIVAMGTSAPELAVSITAGIAGSNEIAISNVIGSNIFNLLMVVGVCGAVMPMNVDNNVLKREFPLVLGVQALLLFFCVNSFMGPVFGNVDGTNVLSRAEGVVLVVVFIGFIYYTVKSALQSRKDNTDEEEFKVLKPWVSAVFIIGGALGIVLGGDFVVDSATFIASEFGLSQTFIGLTVVAMGTSLPELVTSLTAIKKGENDLALGNVLGSNLFNILFVLAMSTTLTPIVVLQQNVIDLAFLVVISIVVFFMAKGKRQVSRKEGLFMIAAYFAYTAYLIMRA